MDKPSFQLEGFEGPLDLLLHLISKNKLNIYDINISKLLEQYMLYIDAASGDTTEIASEFLEMASRLVYIKSVSLLPKTEEAKALKDELSGELLEYRACRALAEKLGTMSDGMNRFVREPQEIEPDRTYVLTHDKKLILVNYLAAVGRGMRRMPPSEESFKGIVHRTVISVSSKIVYLLRTLKKNTRVQYRSLFKHTQTRSEAVATFLAVLELIKANRIRISGKMENPEIEMSAEK